MSGRRREFPIRRETKNFLRLQLTESFGKLDTKHRIRTSACSSCLLPATGRSSNCCLWRGNSGCHGDALASRKRRSSRPYDVFLTKQFWMFKCYCLNFPFEGWMKRFVKKKNVTTDLNNKIVEYRNHNAVVFSSLKYFWTREETLWMISQIDLCLKFVPLTFFKILMRWFALSITFSQINSESGIVWCLYARTRQCRTAVLFVATFAIHVTGLIHRRHKRSSRALSTLFFVWWAPAAVQSLRLQPHLVDKNNIEATPNDVTVMSQGSPYHV